MEELVEDWELRFLWVSVPLRRYWEKQRMEHYAINSYELQNVVLKDMLRPPDDFTNFW